MLGAQGLLDQFIRPPEGMLNAGADQGQGAAPPNAAGGGLDLQSLISGPGGLATGAVAGGLAGLLLGKNKDARKFAGSALKIGGAALVGGLAYKAWRDWQANRTPAVTSAPESAVADASGTPFLPSNPNEREDLSRSLIRAMIAAAKADGHVTPGERARIGEELDKLRLDRADRSFVEAELAKPLDAEAVAAAATGPEHAAEIYAASLLAIDPYGEQESRYLAQLADRLQLEPGLVDHLHANVESVVEREAA